MSIDVQFCSLVDSLQVVGASEIEGATPRTIRLVGRSGFQDAQRVIINDYAVDSFTIVNDNYLLVSPPSLFDALQISQMSFSVVSSSYTGGKSARVVFGPTKNVRKVSGLQKLVQQVVKTLLSNSNSNKFYIGTGGDLLKTLGSTLSPEAKSQITAAVASSVSRTEEQIRAAQSQAQGLLASEKLLSMQLGAVNFVTDNLEVRADIRLITYAGKSIDIPLSL